MFFNEKEMYKFQANNIDVNLPSQFSLSFKSNKLNYVDAEELYLKGNINDFSVDYNKLILTI